MSAAVAVAVVAELAVLGKRVPHSFAAAVLVVESLPNKVESGMSAFSIRMPGLPPKPQPPKPTHSTKPVVANFVAKSRSFLRLDRTVGVVQPTRKPLSRMKPKSTADTLESSTSTDTDIERLLLDNHTRPNEACKSICTSEMKKES